MADSCQPNCLFGLCRQSASCNQSKILFISFFRKIEKNLFCQITRHPQAPIFSSTRTCSRELTLESSHTFSAFWLRSSVVSVLISLISDTRCKASFEINSISHSGLLNRLLAVWVVTRDLGVALFPWLRTAPFNYKDNFLQSRCIRNLS